MELVYTSYSLTKIRDNSASLVYTVNLASLAYAIKHYLSLELTNIGPLVMVYVIKHYLLLKSLTFSKFEKVHFHSFLRFIFIFMLCTFKVFCLDFLRCKNTKAAHYHKIKEYVKSSNWLITQAYYLVSCWHQESTMHWNPDIASKV